jgi:hypothetical protein
MMSSVMFYLKLTIVHGVRSWPHPLNCVRACVRLLFEGGYMFFGGAATNRGAASIRINMVIECGNKPQKAMYLARALSGACTPRHALRNGCTAMHNYYGLSLGRRA